MHRNSISRGSLKLSAASGLLVLGLGVLALLVGGCAPPRALDTPIDTSASHSSAVDHTQPNIGAIPGWNGGCYWPEVNLFSGNLFLAESLLDLPALGMHWDWCLYYNSTQSNAATSIGLGWRHSYDIALQPGQPGPTDITVLWGDGRRDVFMDDGSGWAAPVALEGRRITTAAGGYRLRDKHGRLYDFDTAGRLQSMQDRNGNIMGFAYDGMDRLIRQTDASGRACDLSYDGAGHLVSIATLPAQPIQLTYTGDLLVQVTDEAGFSSQYQYDGLSRLVGVQDPDGDALLVEYYSNLPVVKQVTTGDALRFFTYDATNRVTRVNDRLGGGMWSATAYMLDALGRCVSVEDGPLGVTHNTFDPVTNRCTSHTDADGHTTHWSWDVRGNLISSTDAMGLTETYTYDPTYSLPLTQIDRMGNTWSWQYDTNGNLLASLDPLGNQQFYTYTPQGLVATATDPRGLVSHFTYDADGNLVTCTDPAGFIVTASYNGRSHLVAFHDQLGNAYVVGRDARDAVTSLALPGGGIYRFAWTGSGHLASMLDPLNATTTFQYDACKNLIARTDALGATTSFVRNGAGLVLRAIDALGRTEEYAYDAADRLVRRTDPEGGIAVYAWNTIDLQSYIDPIGDVTNFSYTVRHELAAATSPGLQKTYQYDGLSRLVRAALDHPPDPQLATSYVYDGAGRLTAQTQEHLGRTTSLTLDPNGNPISLQDNLRPTPVTFSYDNRNLCVMADAVAVRAAPSYEQRGLVRSIAFPGMTSRSDYTYDSDARLASIVNRGTGFTATYSFVTNARGDLVSGTYNTPATGALSQTLDWDPTSRLLTESYAPGSIMNYVYDAVGNRIQRLSPPAPPDLYTYSPAHRLLSAGALVQTWDARGDVIQAIQPGVSLDYTYRSDGALETITRNGQTWRFRVGALGELAGVVLPGGQEQWYALDLANCGLLRRAVLPGPALQPTEEYVHVAGGLEARGVEPAPVLWLEPPFTTAAARGVMIGPSGIAQITNSTGTLVSDRFFGLFGDVLGSLGGTHPIQGFQGMDQESGLDEVSIPNLAGEGGLFTSTLPVRPYFSFARVMSDPYMRLTGSFQGDLGFGPDGYFPGCSTSGCFFQEIPGVPPIPGPKPPPGPKYPGVNHPPVVFRGPYNPPFDPDPFKRQRQEWVWRLTLLGNILQRHPPLRSAGLALLAVAERFRAAGPDWRNR